MTFFRCKMKWCVSILNENLSRNYTVLIHAHIFTLFLGLRSAPACTNSIAIAWWEYFAARWSAVLPSCINLETWQSKRHILKPLNSCIACASHAHTLFVIDTLAFFWTKHLTITACPSIAAMWSGVLPSWNYYYVYAWSYPCKHYTLKICFSYDGTLLTSFNKSSLAFLPINISTISLWECFAALCMAVSLCWCILLKMPGKI